MAVAAGAGGEAMARPRAGSSESVPAPNCSARRAEPHCRACRRGQGQEGDAHNSHCPRVHPRRGTRPTLPGLPAGATFPRLPHPDWLPAPQVLVLTCWKPALALLVNAIYFVFRIPTELPEALTPAVGTTAEEDVVGRLASDD